MNSNPSETNSDLQNSNLVDSASSNQANNSITSNETESSSNDAIDSNAVDSIEEVVVEAPTTSTRRSSRLSSKKRIVFTEIDSDVDDEEKEQPKPLRKKKRSGKTSNNQYQADDYTLDDNNDKKKKAKLDAKQEASAPSKPSKILYLEPTDYKIDFDLLCGGIIQNIFSYIPSTRGLFSLSQMSKRLRSLLTYEHIVRVVVLSEKNEKIKDLENLISSCTEARFIYMPSVQRLLRMMVSSKCELGEECWAYNMEEERPGRVTSHGYQSGLHLCYQCEEAYFHGHQMLGRWSRTWVDQTLTECFGSNCRWKNFLPTKEFFEQSTGELIGPFLEIKDFKSIEATYKNLTDRENETCREKLKELLEALREEDDNYERGQELGEFLKEAEEEKELRKHNLLSKLETNAITRDKKKYSRVKALHGQLEKAVGDHEWKEKILSGTWKAEPTDRAAFFSSYHTPVKYNCWITRSFMSAFLSAPSKGTVKAMTQMKTNIMQVFNTMHQNDFFSYSFLSEEEALESDLRALCRQHLATDNFLHIQYGSGAPGAVMSAIQTGDLKDFLVFFLTNVRGNRNILKELFLNQTHFTHPNHHHEHLSRGHFEKMAEKFFWEKVSSSSFTTFASFSEEFQSSTENYNTMVTDLKTLMDSDIFEEEIIENRNDRYAYNNRLSMIQAFKRSLVNAPRESIGSTEQEQRDFFADLRTRRSRYSPWGWNAGMSEFRAVHLD